jgi:hypothetical protein
VSALVRLLYPAPVWSRSPGAVIRWWERKRLTYNIVVGTAGLSTLLVVNALGLLPPGPRFAVVPLPAIIVFGVLANVFYTAGSVVEVVFNAWWKDDPPQIGPILFRQGLIFSVGLALLPIGIAAVDWVFRLAKVLF